MIREQGPNMTRSAMWFTVMVIVLMFTGDVSAQHLDRRVDNLETSWIGNSFAGGDRWVQNSIFKMQVQPDGTVYTWSGWDEAGRRYGIYKDGDVIGNEDKGIETDRVTVAGHTWYIVDYEERRQYRRWGTGVAREGSDLELEDVVMPTGLGIDRVNDLLMVADDGIGQRVVKFYDPETGELVRTFGVPGGIYPSEVGGDPSQDGVIESDLQFWDLTGTGTDDQGNIYVAMSEEGQSGSSIRVFNHEGDELLWEVHSHLFTDVGGFEPGTDGKIVRGMQERYVIDYDQPPGQQYTRVGYSQNSNRDRDDWRQGGLGAAMFRKVDGRLFMFQNTQGNRLTYYRFDRQSHGEIAIPVRPLYDLVERGARTNFHITGNADVWKAYGSTITGYRCRGVNDDGELEWDEPVTFGKPEAFGHLLTVNYAGGESDTMYVGGFPPGEQPHGWWHVGSLLARYDNWHDEPELVWSIELPYAHEERNVPDRVVNSVIVVEGDYVFVNYCIYNTDEPEIDTPGVINVYRKDDGSFVGEIFAGPEVHWQSSWHDIRPAFDVKQRANGEYVILSEENWKAKTLLFRWRPED